MSRPDTFTSSSAATRSSLMQRSGPVVALIPAYNEERFIGSLVLATGEADIVLGSRFRTVKSAIPPYCQVGQHGLTLATNLTSGVWVSDSQSGFRTFSAAAIEDLNFSKGGFSLESEMQFLIRHHSLRLVEVPIKVIYAEPAKRNPFAHGMQVIHGILQLVGQSRPLLFFSGLGLTLFMDGFLLGIHIVSAG